MRAIKWIKKMLRINPKRAKIHPDLRDICWKLMVMKSYKYIDVTGSLYPSLKEIRGVITVVQEIPGFDSWRFVAEKIYKFKKTKRGRR